MPHKLIENPSKQLEKTSNPRWASEKRNSIYRNPGKILVYTSIISWTFRTKCYKTELDPVKSGVAHGNTTKIPMKTEYVKKLTLKALCDIKMSWNTLRKLKKDFNQIDFGETSPIVEYFIIYLTDSANESLMKLAVLNQDMSTIIPH